MKVALVHDDLVQWGGAEKVLLALAEIFPDAPIYTSVYDSSHPFLGAKLKTRKIITSFLQEIPGWKSFYKALLPLYPLAFEQFDFSAYDVVIHHSTRFAKSIITKPKTKHICYCATPPRFLWNLSGEKVPPIIKPYLSFLRFYDQISAHRVDQWVAGSENAARRIKKIYKTSSVVVPPFVDDYFAIESFMGDYFLIVARLNKYKRIDLAVDCFNKNGLKLKIVGQGKELGSLRERAKSNVEFLGEVSEATLMSLLSGCRSLIVTGEEDFGLSSLEAQMAGKPVIAYGKGGSLETVIEGKTGVFFYEQSPEGLEEAVSQFLKREFNPRICRDNASKYSKEVFKKRIKKLVQ